MELVSVISIYSLASVELFDPLQAPLSLFFHVSSVILGIVQGGTKKMCQAEQKSIPKTCQKHFLSLAALQSKNIILS